MDYKAEIETRKTIRQKIYAGEKISKEERNWLVTHPVYHENMGFPILRCDVFDIKPNIQYIVTLKKLCSQCPCKIGAIISVPIGKGKINVDEEVFDLYNRAKKPGTSIKSFLVDFEDSDEKSFLYMSTIGKVGVSYRCQYFEKINNMIIASSSDGADLRFAMIKEKVADNKLIYSCKSVLGETFDALVFSIEFNEV